MRNFKLCGKMLTFQEDTHIPYTSVGSIVSTNGKCSASSFTKSLHDLLNKQENNLLKFSKQVEYLLINQSGHYDKFLSFIKTCSEQDDTWKFWAKFVLEDCIQYIGLFL